VRADRAGAKDDCALAALASPARLRATVNPCAPSSACMGERRLGHGWFRTTDLSRGGYRAGGAARTTGCRCLRELARGARGVFFGLGLTAGRGAVSVSETLVFLLGVPVDIGSGGSAGLVVDFRRSQGVGLGESRIATYEGVEVGVSSLGTDVLRVVARPSGRVARCVSFLTHLSLSLSLLPSSTSR